MKMGLYTSVHENVLEDQAVENSRQLLSHQRPLR